MPTCWISLGIDIEISPSFQGLISSAQMVKFLAINARPTATRSISRALPSGLSRAFIGR